MALARALAPEPRAMLLDEPFSGLDSLLRAAVREAAAAVLREAGTPVLFVTHDPEEAMLMADRIAVMRAGRILQTGPPDVLHRRPADPFCATFLGEAQRLDGVVRGGRVRTPVGVFAAPGLADGAAAQVLVRPEGVRLGADSGPAATVRAVRSLGRAGLVTLTLDGGGELRARAPWWALPEAGDADAVRRCRRDGVCPFPRKTARYTRVRWAERRRARARRVRRRRGSERA